MNGLCECGCGKETKVSDVTNKCYGYTKGEYFRFLPGHYLHKRGENNPNWKGGRRLLDGYVLVQQPNHPEADRGGYVLESHLLAEKTLGKELPESVVIHHVDGKKGQQNPRAIVICQDDVFHMLLHKRLRAYRQCGHTSWVKCRFCKTYDTPENLYVDPRGCGSHRSCHSKYEAKRRKTINGRTSV